MTAANTEHVYVPAGCTGELQPMDLSVNGDFKAALKNEFTEYYADQVAKHCEHGQLDTNFHVDLKLTTLKPIHARWIVKVFDNIKSKRDVILTGWRKSGILGALKL